MIHADLSMPTRQEPRTDWRRVPTFTVFVLCLVFLLFLIAPFQVAAETTAGLPGLSSAALLADDGNDDHGEGKDNDRRPPPTSAPATAAPRPTATPRPTASASPTAAQRPTPSLPPTATPQPRPTPELDPPPADPAPPARTMPAGVVPAPASPAAATGGPPAPASPPAPAGPPASASVPSLSRAAPRSSAAPAGAPGGASDPTPLPPKIPVVLPRAAIAATSPAAVPPPVSAAPLPPTDDTRPQYVLGFAFLRQQVGALMGEPVQNERTNPDSCDTQQKTTTGLAYWSCATGILSFVADLDGLQHWAWVDGQLIEWTGPSADPPAAAEAAPSSIDLTAPWPACVEPNDGPDSACVLLNGMSLSGFIREPGATRAYRVDIVDPTTHLLAALTDLPADYDLYLADPTGAVLAQSVHEGTTPEFLDLAIPNGTYYVYVHVDPSRDFDTDNPFWLHLSLDTSGPARDDVGEGIPGPAD